MYDDSLVRYDSNMKSSPATRFAFHASGLRMAAGTCALALYAAGFASGQPLSANPSNASHTERFVDATKGDDKADGSKQSPWRTIAAGLARLQPGDTLSLRAGVYRESVRVSVTGKPDAPITLRSYPGEMATIDGTIAEFMDTPSTAWEPVPDGAEHEYRSTRAYPNLRDMLGAFADSNIGLQTYWHLQDLRATNELWDEDGTDVRPLYVGPGLFYNAQTGCIHLRLAHTRLAGDIVNYTGETDPRKTPLMIAAFRTVPLHIDGARHVKFQNLTIRGGGYDTVVLDQASDIELDRVVVYCGTYGLKASSTQRLRISNSAFYGNLPPWSFRNENSLRNRPGRNKRDIARLSGHALLVAETGYEHSVYAIPANDDWEISHSTFTNCHDGVYLGGINVKFHHNRLDNMQDDGIYISPVYPSAQASHVQIYQNHISRCLTAFALGGPLSDVRQTSVSIYRNVVDQREGVNASRPTPAKPTVVKAIGNVMGDHGSPPWPKMNIYHNTMITSAAPRQAAMGMLGAIRPGDPARQVLNNAFVSLDKLSPYAPPAQPGSVDGGSLYWGTNLAGVTREKYLGKFLTPEGSPTTGSVLQTVVGDPQFENVDKADFRLKPGSPAIDAGVAIPPDWPDPLRSADAGSPDIGALPAGTPALSAGSESVAPK